MINNVETNTLIKELEEAHHFALSKISHEIRNPVTLINSFLQLIETQHPEVKGFKYWSDTIENMEYLKSLLSELSDYNNSNTLHTHTINPYRLLESLASSVIPTLQNQKVEIKVIKETALPTLSLDETKMREALLNLIRNSAEAMPEGGIITLTIYSDGCDVTIEVSDNGPGIPDEYMETLFKAFVTHKKEGTGLGLAITKNVIEAHKGTITVRSKPGAGSTFTITLPV